MVGFACANCGRHVDGTGRKTRFCCRKCAKEYHNRNRERQHPKVFACVNCGKQVERTGDKRTRFCSKECAVKYRNDNRLHHPRPEIEFDCTQCGKHVVTEGGNDRRTRFCCQNCEKKYWRHPPFERRGYGTTFQSGRAIRSWEKFTNE